MLPQIIPLNINSIDCNENYNYIIIYKYTYNFYEKYFNYILDLVSGLF